MNEPTTKTQSGLVPTKENVAFAPRLLYVEDEPMVRRTVMLALKYAGYTVITAKDGQEAWDTLQTEPFDLLITDNEMPNLCGEELVVKVREHGFDLPIIIASSQLEFFLNPDNDWLQIAKVLPKPFPLLELVDAVKFSLHADQNCNPTQCASSRMGQDCCC